MNTAKNVPWVEKYRPDNFENIVLSDYKKRIFSNIISKKSYFPNMIFFGPPGTGKTTTIINIINSFHSNTKKPLIIHLNASDDRGIEIIRTHVLQFVSSCGLFQTGLKFIILDEIDNMTRSAQLALKYVIEHTYPLNVRFCLICNYVSKIDISLAQNFLMFRFNTHPVERVYFFLNKILQMEKIQLSEDVLYGIINIYESDIRSMINYIQLNKELLNRSVITIPQICVKMKNCNKKTEKVLAHFRSFSNMRNQKNIDLIKEIINVTFLTLLSKNLITCEFVKYASIIYHNIDIDDRVLILFFYEKILPYSVMF